jgi:hypothetical protein
MASKNLQPSNAVDVPSVQALLLQRLCRQNALDAVKPWSLNWRFFGGVSTYRTKMTMNLCESRSWHSQSNMAIVQRSVYFYWTVSVYVIVAESDPVKPAPFVGATDTPMYRVIGVALAELVATVVGELELVDSADKLPIAAGVELACTIERLALENVLDTYAVSVFVDTD